MWTRSSRVREWDLEEKADEIYNRVKGSRQPERWGVRNVSNDQNLSQTAAIDVLFSINFAVVFDFIYFRFRPSKAKWIGNVLPNRQNAANYLQRFFFWINFMCSHPLWFWGRDTLAFGRGGGGVPIPTRGQTLLYSRYVCTSPLGMNRCVNTKDGTLLSAPLYWRNDAPCAIRQCATILQRL
jgi:hypothetical protein